MCLAAGSPEAGGSGLVNSVAQPHQQGPDCYHSSPGLSSGHSSGPQTAALWTQIRKSRHGSEDKKKNKSLAWIIFRTWQKQKLNPETPSNLLKVTQQSQIRLLLQSSFHWIMLPAISYLSCIHLELISLLLVQQGAANRTKPSRFGKHPSRVP